MKKFSKILVAALALTLLIGVLALVVSADNNELPSVDGTYVVNGVGYDSWTDALAAANGEAVIYLNEDIEPAVMSDDAAFAVKNGEKIVFDFNGHNVKQVTKYLFRVSKGSLELRGETNITNAATVVFAYGAESNIKIHGYGKGIDVDLRDEGFNVFHIYDGTTFDVTGDLTVTPGKAACTLFLLYNGKQSAGKTVFDNARVHMTAPASAGGGVSNFIVVTDGMDMEIKDSRLEINYGKLIVSKGATNFVDVSSYMNADLTWKENAAENVKLPDFTVNVRADNSVLISKDGGYTKGTSQINATLMTLDGSRFRGDFNDCILVGESRAINASAQVGTKKLNPCMLTFNDCHIKYGGTNASGPYVFCYGVNYKINGGSVHYHTYSMSAGEFHYLELPDGNFVGGKMDNVLLGGRVGAKQPGKNAGNWNWITDVSGSTFYNNININLVIDGEPLSYIEGYFSDKDAYDAYFKIEGSEHVYRYDGNTPGGDFYKAEGSATKTGTVNFPCLTIRGKTAAGELKTVYDEDGNGYFKYSYSGNKTDSSKDQYDTLKFGGNIKDYDFVVLEFDIAADSDFTYTNFTVAGRSYLTQYKADGTVLESGSAGYQTKPVPPALRVDGNLAYVANIPTSETSLEISPDGTWHRISVIIEVNISELMTAPVPSYSAVDKKDGGTYNAKVRDYSETKLHYYVDGTHLYTYNWGEYMGYDGYVIDGDLIYLSDFWIAPTAYNETSSIAIDNMRLSQYIKGSVNDKLGLYDEEGNLNTSVENNPNFLIMPYGMPKAPFAIVDGVEYTTEDEALAAIKDGSYVKLNESPTKALDLDGKNVTFKLEDGVEIGSYYSSTHKLYTYANGTARTVLADEVDRIELSFVNERFGVNVSTSAVEGSVVPHLAEAYPELDLPYDGSYHKINGWLNKNGSVLVHSFFVETDGTMTLYPTYRLTPYYYTIMSITEDGDELEYYTAETLSEDLAAAFSECKNLVVTLWNGMNVQNLSVVPEDAKLCLDLNGNVINAEALEALFYMLPGSELAIGSSKEGGTVYAPSTVIATSNYDDTNPKSVKLTIGEVMDEYYDVYAKGENLTVFSNVLALYLGVGSAEQLSTGAYLASMDVNIKGGAYEMGEYGAALAAGAVMNASVSDAIVTSEGFIAILAGEEELYGAKLTLAVSGSVVEAQKGFVGGLNAASSVSVSDTDIMGELGDLSLGSFTVGEKVGFSITPEALLESGAKLGEGLVPAYADCDNDYFTLNSYVDAPSNLAKINWLDSDGTTVIGTTYNVPYGKLVEVYGKEDVSAAVGTDWYDVGFDRWDIAEDFELSVGEFTIAPICETKVASLNALKINVTAYTYFKINFYLPKNVSGEGLEGFELYGLYRKYTSEVSEDMLDNPNYELIGGVWYELLPVKEVLLEGEEHYMYNTLPSAFDATEEEYTLIFAIGEGEEKEIITKDFEYGIPTYAQAVMNGEDSTELDKKLIINMVRYANESYKLANGGEGCKLYCEMLEKYAEYLIDLDSVSFSEKELAADASGLADYIEGATFVFGTYQPRFVFKYKNSILPELTLPDGSDGKINVWPEGNLGVFTHIYYESFNGSDSYDYIANQVGYDAYGNVVAPLGEEWSAENVYAMTDDMLVFDMTEVINLAVYTPEGTVVRGSYSLAQYISHLRELIPTFTEGTEEYESHVSFYNASMALYAFSLASIEYAG